MMQSFLKVAVLRYWGIFTAEGVENAEFLIQFLLALCGFVG